MAGKGKTDNKPVNGGDGDSAIDLSAVEGSNRINGGDGNDTLIGSAFYDRINAGDGDDIVEGGEGDDVMFGNDGFDTAVFNGSILDFQWGWGNGGSLFVTDLNTADGNEGQDELKHFEALQFDDFTLMLDGSNNGPLVQLGAQTTDEDTAKDFTVDAYDFDGGTLEVLSVSVTGGGTITLAPGSTVLTPGTGTGAQFTVSFDPNGAYDYLAVTESTVETIEIVVSDGQGGTTTITQDLTITGVNDAPTTNDDTGQVSEDGPGIIIDLLANDTDPDSSDILSIDSFDFTGLNGSVTDNGDGTITYNPNGAFEALNDGETAADSFTYTVSDGHGGTSTATVDITIDGVTDSSPTTLIDFESFDFNGAFVSFSGSYFGLNWSGSWYVMDSATFGGGAYELGTTSGEQVAFNGFGWNTILTGDDFDLESAYMTSAWKEELTVWVYAYDDGVFLGRQDIVLNNDGPTFIEFDDALFDSVDQVVFHSTGGGTNQFVMDDLTVFI